MGTGCAKCNKLEEMVREAVSDLKSMLNLSKNDINRSEYDIMITPGLVVDGEIMLWQAAEKDEIRTGCRKTVQTNLSEEEAEVEGTCRVCARTENGIRGTYFCYKHKRSESLMKQDGIGDVYFCEIEQGNNLVPRITCCSRKKLSTRK